MLKKSCVYVKGDLMSYVKAFGLATMIAAALVTCTGTASATSLTSPAGTTYTGTVKAESEGVVKIICSFATCGTITCKAGFEFKVETHGLTTTVSGNVTSFTLTGCTGGSATSPVTKRGAVELHTEEALSNGNGTFEWTGGVFVVHGTLIGTCTFEIDSHLDTLTGSSKTGGKATIDLHGVVDTNCGTLAIFDGSFTITSPSVLYVD
jgi:hypothetical protein